MRGTMSLLLALLVGVTACPLEARAQAEDPRTVDVPPPPPQTAPAPPPPQAAPPPLVWAPPPPPPRPSPELLPAPVPFMLGFGFAVLGGFGIAGTTAVLLEAPSVDGELIGGATLAYLFSAAFGGVGLFMMAGALTGDVKLYSRAPGWPWTAAIFSTLGGLGAIAAVTSWLVDGDFGADSIGYTLASIGCYGLTLLVFLGLDEADDPGARLGVVPLPGGGAMQVSGRF